MNDVLRVEVRAGYATIATTNNAKLAARILLMILESEAESPSVPKDDDEAPKAEPAP